MDPSLFDTTSTPTSSTAVHPAASPATPPDPALDVATLPVGPMIEQLGGERELARKLDLPASTVQGWKLRDHIPEHYHHRMKNLLQEIDAEPAPPAPADMARPETSRLATPQPSRANPNAAYYAMPQSTMRYWVMSSLTGLGLLALVTLTLLGLFFGRDFYDYLAAEHSPAVTAPMPVAPPALTGASAPIENNLEQSRAALDDTLESVQKIKQQADPNQTALVSQIDRIENVVTGLRDRVDQMDQTLRDKGVDTGTIRREISDLSRRDVLAAALLLGVAQIHGLLDAQASFTDDLAFLKALSANDPAMTASLDKLAPFAEKGLMTREQMLDTLDMVGHETMKVNHMRPDLSWSQKIWVAMNNVIEIRRKPPEPVVTAQGKQFDVSTPQGQLEQAKTYIENDRFAQAAQLLQSYQGPGAGQIISIAQNLQGRDAATAVLDNLLQKSQNLLNVDQIKMLMNPSADLPTLSNTTAPAGMN